MTYTGKMRIHFNRHGATPLVWCVATDEWEIAVAAVTCTTVLTTMYRPKATPDDEDGKPSAWLEAEGTLTVLGSTAYIKANGAAP